MRNPEIFSESFFSMGTRCDVVLTGLQADFGEFIFQLIKTEFSSLENKLSRFNPHSILSELNRTEKNKTVKVEDEVWDLLTHCFDFYQMSSGAFDITSAPLVSLWKNKKQPTKNEIEQARRISGFDKVKINFERQELMFLENGVEFDFGAVGKGFALDSIKPILQNQGVKNGIISFGESSILALGKHPNGEYWPLGIPNQLNQNEWVHVFQAKNESVTTSGTLFTNDDGKVENRFHIISPASGLPVEGNKSVSVKTESATLGEFITTTWLILPENDKVILSDQLKNMEILELEYLPDNDIKTKLTLLNA